MTVSLRDEWKEELHRARQAQVHVGLVGHGKECEFYLNSTGDHRGSSGRSWHDAIHILKHQSDCWKIGKARAEKGCQEAIPVGRLF